MNKGATIDPDNPNYRYNLWRQWGDGSKKIVFIMLNPSRADAVIDDPTIRRCINYAQSWDFGLLEVVNLFAYRTKNPSDLAKVPDPIGPKNDFYLDRAITSASVIVLAWGNQGCLQQRNISVLKKLVPRNNVYCLGITLKGHPRHPLYLKRNLCLVRYQDRIHLN